MTIFPPLGKQDSWGRLGVSFRDGRHMYAAGGTNYI